MAYVEGQTGHLALHDSIDQSILSHTAAIAAGDVTDPTSAAGISLSATYARIVKVSDMVAPMYMPHRGAGTYLAPENTLEAFKVGHALRTGVLDGGDLRLQPDGSFLSLHSTVTDLTTKPLLNSWALGAPVAKTLVVDTARWFGGGWGNQQVLEWTQLRDTFGGKAVLFPEIKTDGTSLSPTVMGETLRDDILAHGLKDSVVVGSFTEAALIPCAAAGIATCRYITNTGATVDVAALVAQGFTDVGLDITGNVPSSVQRFLNAGLRVWVYSPARQVDRAAWLAAGVFGFHTNDPVYFQGVVSKYRRTNDPYAFGSYYPGHFPYQDSQLPGARGYFVGGNRLQSDSGGPGLWWNLLGWACPLASPTAFTLDYRVAYDVLGSDVNRHADLAFGCPTDVAFSDSQATGTDAYNLIARRDGRIQLYKIVNGVTSGPLFTITSSVIVAPLVLTAALPASSITTLPVTAIAAAIPVGTQFALPTGQIATVSTAASVGATSIAISAVTPTEIVPSASSLPQSIPLKLEVTSTTIKVTRGDTAATSTVTDSTYRGPYMHIGTGGAGIVCSWSNFTVS